MSDKDEPLKEPRFRFTVSNTTLTYRVTGAVFIGLIYSAWIFSIADAVDKELRDKEHKDMLVIVKGNAEKEGLEPKVIGLVRRLDAQGREVTLLTEWMQTVKDKEKLAPPPPK